MIKDLVQLAFGLSNGLSFALTFRHSWRAKLAGSAVLLVAHPGIAAYFLLTGQPFFLVGNAIMTGAGVYGVVRALVIRRRLAAGVRRGLVLDRLRRLDRRQLAEFERDMASAMNDVVTIMAAPVVELACTERCGMWYVGPPQTADYDHSHRAGPGNEGPCSGTLTDPLPKPHSGG